MDITCLIPVAPIPSNPSSVVLDETITSIRERLPEAEIILMFDAVDATHEEFRVAYEEFTNKMLWRCEHELHKVFPLLNDTHSHQSLMTKRALSHVSTSLLLWSEQDTPLHGEIPFEDLSPIVTTGYANLIRFHHEASVLPEHASLMLDTEPITLLGQPLLRTKQWSGRPHLALTDFYRKIADTWDNEPRFIEHIMYGPVSNGEFRDYRLHLYAPEGTLVRSLHRDGRRLGAASYDPTAS